MGKDSNKLSLHRRKGVLWPALTPIKQVTWLVARASLDSSCSFGMTCILLMRQQLLGTLFSITIQDELQQNGLGCVGPLVRHCF